MRIIMTTVQSAEQVSDFGTVQPLFPRMGEMPDRYREIFRMNGIDLSVAEANELILLEEFLSRHVEAGENGDVQCMLLWNEWVRAFKHRTADFPNLIREREFRSVITGKFGTGVASDGWRGAIYPGVRYVP